LFISDRWFLNKDYRYGVDKRLLLFVLGLYLICAEACWYLLKAYSKHCCTGVK
jgi:hypothetical protein